MASVGFLNDTCPNFGLIAHDIEILLGVKVLICDKLRESEWKVIK